MFNVHTIFFNNPVVAYFDTKFWIYSFIFANFTKYFSPWNLMTTSIDVLFNTCLWINLMSAIYWMCYLFHSICGKRKPWIKLKGRAQIDLSHVIVTVDFITVVLSLNDHLKYRNFITQKTLTIIIVHLHSNIDSLVQRNCLVLYFDKEVFIFYNIIYSAVMQSKQCNERNKHSW